MENLILEKEHIITSAETDISGHLRAGALLNICIQAAIDSADLLGFGYRHLHPQKLFWVLSRFSIEINRPLDWKEKIYVQTWPKGMDRIFYLRDFVLLDNQMNEIGKATSAWLAVHSDTRRPGKIETEDTDVIFGMAGKHALEYLPINLTEPNGSLVETRIPRNFDFDLNGHVTSTRYIDWMLDTLPLDTFKKKTYTAFHINFLKEIMPEDEVEIFEADEAGIITWEGRHKALQRPAFRGQVHFT